jgi:hypothetical protein
MHSTKSHESHPNFVFLLENQPWVTRFKQKDAVCLTDMSQRIDVVLERVNDGYIIGDSVYFTTIDGRFVCADRVSKNIERVFDLNETDGEGVQFGWCRGLLLEGNITYAGFTRIHRTATKENVTWLPGKVFGKNMLPTRIAKYDMVQQGKLSEVKLPCGMIDAGYRIVRAQER